MKISKTGFSLIELMIALSITVGIGAILFQLFQQNEKIFRDQNLMVEMQQNARAVASQIADEIRMAGQGVPVYAATFDASHDDAVATILPSSNATRIDFRAGLSNVETGATGFVPLDLILGVSRTISVLDGSTFSSALGTTTPSGKFVYLWGPSPNSSATWVRAELNRISSTTLTLTPRQASPAALNAGTIRFAQSPTISLDEAVSYQFADSVIRRATAANMNNPASPAWSAANEIGRNFTALSFAYYDAQNVLVNPASTSRFSISRVDVRIVAQPGEALSDGTRPAYTFSMRTIPRNLRIR